MLGWSKSCCCRPSAGSWRNDATAAPKARLGTTWPEQLFDRHVGGRGKAGTYEAGKAVVRSDAFVLHDRTTDQGIIRRRSDACEIEHMKLL